MRRFGLVLAQVALLSQTNCRPEVGVSLDCTLRAPVIDSAVFPVDVTCNTTNNAAAFNDYSWRAFLAVTRRASVSRRGEADPAYDVSAAGSPRVFESYKASWELFRNKPRQWSTMESVSPCANVSAKHGDLILSSFDKMDDIQQLTSDATASGPLVAQNQTYVRYAVGYNRTAYEALVRNKWYETKGLGAYGTKPVMPNGSVAVKSAWMLVTAATARPERYYRRSAWVRSTPTDLAQCVKAEVALIALHIIQKTAKSPQWIWTTFEHIDNVPPRVLEAQRSGPFALHDNGLATSAMPPDNPLHNAPLVSAPPAMNVVSDLPLSSAVMGANAAYRARLSAAASPWQYFQLIVTQWPKNLGEPDERGDPSSSIPGTGAVTAYANPAIETYFQTPIHNGCMSCHDSARDLSDFLWGPVVLATDEGADAQARLSRQAALRTMVDRLKVRR